MSADTGFPDGFAAQFADVGFPRAKSLRLLSCRYGGTTVIFTPGDHEPRGQPYAEGIVVNASHFHLNVCPATADLVLFLIG